MNAISFFAWWMLVSGGLAVLGAILARTKRRSPFSATDRLYLTALIFSLGGMVINMFAPLSNPAPRWTSLFMPVTLAVMGINLIVSSRGLSEEAADRLRWLGIVNTGLAIVIFVLQFADLTRT